MGDAKSISILKALVSKEKLDPDCLEQDSFDFRRDDEDDTKYYYLGARLMAIVDETKSTRPRWDICLWIEPRSYGRYAMLVTVIGIMFTVLFGIGAILIGAFQISSERHL